MFNCDIFYVKEPPSEAKPRNDAYRKLRGTHKPFSATPEQANAEWQRINAEEIAAVRKKREQAIRFAARFRKGGLAEAEED
jgi:hypothetical protein